MVTKKNVLMKKKMCIEILDMGKALGDACYWFPLGPPGPSAVCTNHKLLWGPSLQQQQNQGGGPHPGGSSPFHRLGKPSLKQSGTPLKVLNVIQ